MDDGRTKFEVVNDLLELALNYPFGQHEPGASVSPDACAACRGGRRPAIMRRVSDWLTARGVDLDPLVWKINRECPGALASVSADDGILLIEGCSVSIVVLADIICGLWYPHLAEEGRPKSEFLRL
ncbi:MAG: hypothetical protein WC246_00050 [Candidatus Paceibacterota bacterium]|jgi:hypothetical protein